MSCGNMFERNEKSKERTHPLHESKSQRMGHPEHFTHSFFDDSDGVRYPPVVPLVVLASLGRLRNQVYSELGADALIQSAWQVDAGGYNPTTEPCPAMS